GSTTEFHYRIEGLLAHFCLSAGLLSDIRAIMRKFIIEDHHLIAPFNEPARDLSILNKPLKIHHADILDEVLGPSEAELSLSTVHDLPHVAPGRDECIVYRDNLYFDIEF